MEDEIPDNPPLVVTMGIPAEGIGLLIAVDAIPDIFMTTLNVTGDMVAAALVSRGLLGSRVFTPSAELRFCKTAALPASAPALARNFRRVIILFT